MITELELSIQAPNTEIIQPLLDEFEAKLHVHVNLRLLSWDTAWSDLVKVALYGDGPDISEVGSTWLGDLIAMNALHAFTSDEINQIGKSSNFLPAAWRGCRLGDQPEVWAIPWLVGARLVFYRRSLLRQAGLDEANAFQTAGQFDRTLHQLQASSCPVPWSVPTGRTHTTLLNVASWVWAAGGDFISADGKHTLFSTPEARAGLCNYFALGRYIAPAVQHLTALQPDTQFLTQDGTAVTISGPWLFDLASAALHADLGVALPPGAPFLGGSHLVVWKHSHKQESAIKLLRFFTQTQAQSTYSRRIGLLPATLDALAGVPADRLWQAAVQGVKTGRTVPVTRSWGLMEDRLSTEFAVLWQEFSDDPKLDLNAALARRLEPLAKRLDTILAQA